MLAPTDVEVSGVFLFGDDMIFKVVNLVSVIKSIRKTNNDFRFATAKALTRTAQVISKEDLPKDLKRSLDRPTRFTQKGFYIQRATKESQSATIGIKDKQAEYMKYQVYGGLRKPHKKLLKLPADIKLDASGNIPRGALRSMITRAKQGKRITRGAGRSARVSSKVDLFYGDPGDGRPVGVYKRVRSGSKDQLIPIVVMPSGEAKYEKRFDFHATVQRHAKRRLNQAVIDAIKETWSR